tara:strand:+ start:2247 stop:2945 length:699 start_codon:yes stop_codon:yes gene_type:complete
VVCECGEEGVVAGGDLNSGKSMQCRKCNGTATEDLKGMRFGCWLVDREGERKNRKTYWVCVCDCGITESVCAASLIKGVSMRCIKCYHKAMPKHGYTCKDNRHPLYDIWMGMLARCENKKSVSYKNYGDRGIKVCERWHDLDKFEEDMGERPDGYTVERIDNEGDYCPANTKWATYMEQGSNRRNNNKIEYDGVVKTVSQWSVYLGVQPSTLFKYLERNTFEEAYAFYTQPY